MTPTHLPGAGWLAALLVALMPSPMPKPRSTVVRFNVQFDV